MKQEERAFIRKNRGTMTTAEMARELGLKERKVAKFLGEDGNKVVPEKSPLRVRGGAVLDPFPSVFVPLWVLVAAIVLAGFLVYADSFGNDFVFDDVAQVVNNTAIRSVKGLPGLFTHELFHFGTTAVKGSFYRPIVSVSFTADYFFWKLKPFGYHLTNTALHAGAALLLFLVAAGILRNRIAAALVALVWVVHPLQTEVVTYISGRADSIAIIFLFLMMYLQRLSWEMPEKKKALYPLIAAVYALALLSKELAVSFIFFMALYEYALRDEKRYAPIGRKEGFLYVCIAAVIGVWFFVKSAVVPMKAMVTNPFPLVTRLITAPRAIFDYLRLTFFPFGLHMEYDWYRPRTLLESGYLEPFVLLLGLIAFGYYAWRRGRTDRFFRVVFFGIAWFLLGLLPYLNIIMPLNAPFSEHWAYAALAGFFIAFVSVVFLTSPGGTPKRAVMAVWIVAAVYFGVLTAKQNLVWKDNFTFYTYSMPLTPHSSKVHNNLGREYMERGELGKAKALFERAILLEPNYTLGERNLARVNAMIASGAPLSRAPSPGVKRISEGDVARFMKEREKAMRTDAP